MAELVDARDLKCVGTTENKAFFCKTLGPNPIENSGTKRDLQNNLAQQGVPRNGAPA